MLPVCPLPFAYLAFTTIGSTYRLALDRLGMCPMTPGWGMPDVEIYTRMCSRGWGNEAVGGVPDEKG